MLMKLWNDESGLIISAELIILLTIGVIALVVGLTALRDSVVTELADVGQAIGNANQSYTITGITGHTSAIAGFGFNDLNDLCDTIGAANNQASKGVIITPANGFVTGNEGR